MLNSCLLVVTGNLLQPPTTTRSWWERGGGVFCPQEVAVSLLTSTMLGSLHLLLSTCKLVICLSSLSAEALCNLPITARSSLEKEVQVLSRYVYTVYTLACVQVHHVYVSSPESCPVDGMMHRATKPCIPVHGVSVTIPYPALLQKILLRCISYCVCIMFMHVCVSCTSRSFQRWNGT